MLLHMNNCILHSLLDYYARELALEIKCMGYTDAELVVCVTHCARIYDIRTATIADLQPNIQAEYIKYPIKEIKRRLNKAVNDMVMFAQSYNLMCASRGVAVLRYSI